MRPGGVSHSLEKMGHTQGKQSPSPADLRDDLVLELASLMRCGACL